MNGELLAKITSIEKEKGIDREVVIEAVKSALISAAKKLLNYKGEDISVEIDKETSQIKVFVGDTQLASSDFGRIAAQTAKQVMTQKIREAERNAIYEEYKNKMGSLINGLVHRIERGSIVVDLGKTEGIVPRVEQSPRERYKQGDRIRAIVLDVRKADSRPQIILSRVSTGLVAALFELEVPEIYEKIVQIKSIAREAGNRTKIAVSSNDEKVDCVGACVGIRGSRVKDIVRELQGERLDIIRWSKDAGEFIKEALSPAEISAIELNEEEHAAGIVVEDDQLSLAIGGRGQNVRLASKLTGWGINISGKSALKALSDVKLSKLESVGPKMGRLLESKGFKDIATVSQATPAALREVPGIGEKTAKKIIGSAKEIMKTRSRDESKGI